MSFGNRSTNEEKLYSALKSCRLCPRQCGADRLNGVMGFCGADADVKIARAALHFWEEPCISGERGSGTVFFSCCTLKCVYCQNYTISTQNRGKIISIPSLAEKFLYLQSLGAHNINLVTPTHYVPQIILSLDKAKEQGLRIPVVYNTSGYESVETLRMLKGYIDIYMPDFKYWKEEYSKKYSSAVNYRETAKAAIDEMYLQTGKNVFDENGIMQRGVIVRHLMLPGLLFDTKKIIDCLYDRFGDNIYLSIMSQYTPLPHVQNFPSLSRRLDMRHYEAIVRYCENKGITNAFIQEGSSAKESFIPPFEE